MVSLKYFLLNCCRIFVRKIALQKIDFLLNLKILLDQWEGVILEIPYGLFRVFSQYLEKKTSQLFNFHI